MITSDYISIISLICVALVIPAILAMLRTRVIAIIEEDRPRTLDMAKTSAADALVIAATLERERLREMFSPKPEVAEIKAQVQQLVANTARFDEKLDRILQLVMERR